MKMAIREALRLAIDEEMTRDHTVFVIGEEVGEYNGAYKVTKGLLEKWGPKRIIDTPISELGFSGLAIGAALCGLRPIVEFMSFNFSFVAADQLISTAPKMHYMSGGRFSVPIVFRGPNGAAAQVSSQHSHSVEAIYSQIPGLIIIAPNTPRDAKGLLKSAIRNNNPVLFLENELTYGKIGEVPSDEELIPIGVANIVKQGRNVTLVSHSRMVDLSMEAALELEKQGISVEVIDLRTIKPLDITTVAHSVRKTGRLVIVEEGHSFAGIAAEITTQTVEHCFDFLDAPIQRVAQKETPMPYSFPLEQATLPTVKKIIDAIHRLYKE